MNSVSSEKCDCDVLDFSPIMEHGVKMANVFGSTRIYYPKIGKGWFRYTCDMNQ